MNKARRKDLALTLALMERARNMLEDIYAEEEDAMNGMPENLQYNSQRWDDAEQMLCDIDDVRNALGEAVDALDGFEGLPPVRTDEVVEAYRLGA